MAEHRRADIQGLRGLAVLLVVAYHGGLHVRGGFTGVDVFFVISGFVITGLLLRELESTGSLRLRHFYARRARRLLPALAAMVVLVELAGLLIGPFATQITSAHTGIAASVFSANLYLYRLSTGGYFVAKATLDPLLHTWTLAVEEQFYVLFPIVLLLAWKLARRPRAVAGVAVGGLSIASFVLADVLSGSGSGLEQRFAFYGSPPRAWEFGVGSLLAIVAPRVRLGAAGARAAGASGIGLVVAGAFAIRGTSGFPGWPTLLPAAGTCALLAAGLGELLLVSRALSHPVIVWIGDRSYSWYLWHFPVIVFARAVFVGEPVSAVAAAVSIIPACLSYRYVENPIRFDKRIVGRRLLAVAASCVAIPAAVSFGCLEAQAAIKRTHTIQLYVSGDRGYADSGCQEPLPLAARTGPRWRSCEFRVAAPHGRIVLVGDSNASQYTAPAARAANELGYDFTAAGLEGCPFVLVRVVAAGNNLTPEPCLRFDRATLAALVQLRPSLVILANRDDAEIGVSEQGLAPLAGGAFSFDPREKERLWAAGLAAVLDRLGAAGIPVLLVRPIPPVPSQPAECAVIRLLLEDCSGRLSREVVGRLLRPAFKAENRALAGAKTAHAVWFEKDLCGRDACTTFGHGILLYRDTYHLTFDGAVLLTPDFKRAIASMLGAPPTARS